MPDTTVQKYQTLIDRLYARTQERKVQWASDIIEPDVLSCAIGKNVIELFEAKKDDSTPIIVIVVRDANGNVVETFNDETLAGVPVTYGRSDSYWSLLVDLLSLVRRQNTGADEILDDILSQLDEPPF